MCTISVLPLDDGDLSLMMNRDESPLRPAALDLRQGHSEGGLEHVAPLDPRSGGTWIAVNASGICFALMNQHPQGFREKRPSKSRGGIIPSLLGCRDVRQALLGLEAMDCSDYAPFFLLVIDASSPYQSLRWDGIQKEIRAYPRQARLFGSSSFETEEVLLGRQSQFEKLLGELRRPGGARDVFTMQRDFHRSHQPGKGPYSICVHRNDAQSLSLTEVLFEGPGIRMNYHAGPPCVAAAEREIQLS